MKNAIQGKFHLRQDAVPVVQRLKPIPYYLQKPLKEWFETSITEDLFGKVPEHQEWWETNITEDLFEKVPEHQEWLEINITEDLFEKVPEHQECFGTNITKNRFEKLPEHEPITWYSPPIVQPKDLESHMIKASVDLQILSTSLLHQRDLESPKHQLQKISFINSMIANLV